MSPTAHQQAPAQRRILVLNCGSSSVKYELFAVMDGIFEVLTRGLVERIGEPGGPVDHAEALGTAAESLPVDAGELVAVGHRVVHGGATFSAPALVTDDVITGIEALIPLAPLHNPPNLAGIAVARQLWPGLPQVAVFDTAFHATLPPAAARYAIDPGLADRYGIRRYGFHGTSHQFVARQTATLLNRPLSTLNIITLHLGNGASACAIAGGRSVETSMGLSPLEGLVMGTRSGDIDPAVIFQLSRTGNLSIDEIDHLLNRRSGLAGLCGDNDVRRVLARRAAGDPAASLAFDCYCHRIRKYVGAYLAVLGRVDAVTFTAGVGENAAEIRSGVLAGLAGLGFVVDEDRNQSANRGARLISPHSAPIAVCVIPTDEEYEIARQTWDVINNG